PQVRERRSGHVERALQVDVDDGPEPVRRQVLGQTDEIACGSVDENVEWSYLVCDSGHHFADRLRMAYVGRFRQGSYPTRADFRRRRVEVIRLAAGDRDIASVRGDSQRDATTDPGAAAGDERHTAVQEIGAEHAD